MTEAVANAKAAAPFGATPPEWEHFARTLGLESDLLPVVSRPGAKISEKSKMRDLGKTPSRFNQQGEVVGMPGWTSHVATDKDVGRWSRDSDLGMCLQTRVVRAIDIDIPDPVAARRVLDMVELGCGNLPRRRRSATGKCLLAFRMPGEFTKRIIRTADGIIEFLANGQQFVAIGTHPSGTRYEWVDADGVLGLPAEIPELTPAEFEALWQALTTAFALPDTGSVTVRNGMVPTRPRQADDLRDPVVAWLDENGWVQEYERDGKVHVRCPWEDEHTSDSGPSASSWFPAGVGGFAQGHYRCLHAHCAGRTDGDFLEAVGYGASDFDVVETVANAKGEEVLPLPAFARDRGGRIEAELNNVLMALQRPDLCGYSIGVDNFQGDIMLGEAGRWRTFKDTDYTRLRRRLMSRSFKPVSPELIKDAARLIAEDYAFDSAIDWARSLQWDGVPRVETFYSDYFGVPDTPYSRAVACYTWTALAARCLEPGAKCDMVPVFIGGQGAGKTTAVQAMSPTVEAFVEVNLERKDDDLARTLRGKLVGEIAELRGLRTRDADAIKSWITRTHEEWVAKWREFAAKYPRRCVFFGTSNDPGFLDDETGERRWLPMLVGDVDVAGIAAARDQLWAEGIVRFELDGVAWEQAYALARAEHSAFKVSDPWEDLITRWLARDVMDTTEGVLRGDGDVRMSDVLFSALGLRAERMDRRAELRAGKILRRLGFIKANVREDGVQAKAWRREQA